MTHVAVIQYQTKPEQADENQRLVEQVFAELATTQPDGLRYATFRMADGVSFMHVVLTEDGVDALPQLEAFQKFSGTIGDRVVGPPNRSAMTVVGSYRFLS